MPDPIVPAAIRDRLALALDVDDPVAAHRLAGELAPWFGVVKVGLELYAATGPDIVVQMVDRGYKVFLDMKLADIPTTVERTARVFGALGVSYLTLHAFTGPVMLRAGVDGLREGASRAGLPVPMALAVTILTSDPDAPPHILGRRVTAAVEGGCGGLVCAARDVAEAKSLAPRLFAAVPGIRPSGTPSDDHANAATPHEAVRAGADLLVVGRAVTAAPDRVAAAASIAAGLADSGTGGS